MNQRKTGLGARLILLLLFLSGAVVHAQMPGVGREAMWKAPTAEDWKKPVLIRWQRTWEDAVELSRSTGKPILVCVNMDGEIASEHYAGIRYRMPEMAAIYEPYVTVIASVYRHSVRDFDEAGERIPCPRFGTVTCGEHIRMEPIVYERFLDGRRIAPRHIGVELDGSEMYDVFYAFDTDSVFATIREGVKDRPTRELLGDRDPSLAELVASPDSAEREQVEERYRSGDVATRRELLRAAVASGEKAPVDLLRLAVFGLDAELNRLALEALAQSTSENAIGLIAEALRVPMEADLRTSLVEALERLGETFPQARTLAAVHRGLAADSDALDLEGWSQALGGAEYPASSEDRAALEYQLESKSQGSKSAPDDPSVWLELAEASLGLAVDPEAAVGLAQDRHTQSKYTALLFEDVRNAARQAVELGAEGWRVEAALAISAYYLGDMEEAHVHAETAVETMPAGEHGWNAMASLAIFAESRQKAIEKAVAAKESWPPEWLTDVNAAYSVLARHPLGTDLQSVAHHDFLRRLGAHGKAGQVLDEALERFPDSWELHARLRGRVLWEKGAAHLESTYREMLARDQESENLNWFAGYASLVVAEFHRRRASQDEALAAYGRGMALFERAIERNPASRASSDHYVALAYAGRARIALEQQDYPRAIAELEASFARYPPAASSLDGLGLTPIMTATTLKARLEEAGDEDGVERVQAALDALDPELLRPPEFEREMPSGRLRRSRR